MTEPTLTIISNTQYKNDYQSKTGSLMFPDDWYNCLNYVNTKILRTNLKRQGINLPKGSKFLKILVPTTDNPEFQNKRNINIRYKVPVCANRDMDGAYYKNYPEMDFSMWVVDFPIGNAIIVISEL